MAKIKTAFLALIIIFSLVPVYAQKISAYKLEIFMKTKDTNGATVTFETECQSTIVWDNNGYITTENKFTNPIDLIITGDYSGTEKGWDTNDDETGNPDLGRAELNGANKSYIISVKNKNAKLKVDCYGNVFKGDVYVMYDYDDDKFYEDGTTNEITTIDLYDNASYLQPTAPKNFQCTNPKSYGSHPNFIWEVPDHPTGVTFTYYIYRDTGSGFQLIGSTQNTSYTDTGVEIKKFGSTTNYYVKAKGSNSPLSAASNTVEIQTDTASKGLPSDGSDQNEDGKYGRNGLTILSIAPNPFNPETKIAYYLPHKSLVRLTIFNMMGQQVVNLVDNPQSAGEHNIIFNGKSLPGGIYLVRLQVGKEIYMQKIFLVK